MYSRTDDPERDYLMYDAEIDDEDEAEWLRSRPKCEECGEPIVEDFKYVVDDCTLCEQCMIAFYRYKI